MHERTPIFTLRNIIIALFYYPWHRNYLGNRIVPSILSSLSTDAGASLIVPPSVKYHVYSWVSEKYIPRREFPWEIRQSLWGRRWCNTDEETKKRYEEVSLKIYHFSGTFCRFSSRFLWLQMPVLSSPSARKSCILKPVRPLCLKGGISFRNSLMLPGTGTVFQDQSHTCPVHCLYPAILSQFMAVFLQYCVSPIVSHLCPVIYIVIYPDPLVSLSFQSLNCPAHTVLAEFPLDCGEYSFSTSIFSRSVSNPFLLFSILPLQRTLLSSSCASISWA